METLPAAVEDRRGLPPLFIVGCARSGTTLISRILDRHSQIAVFHETHFYPVFHPHRRLYGDLNCRRNLEALLSDLGSWLRLRQIEEPPIDEIRQHLPEASLGGVLAGLLACFARMRGKPRAGEKTPEHYRFLSEIQRDFPQSPIVFIVRDPRDVAVSMRKAFRTPIADAAWTWRRAWECYAASARRPHLVRYERLVQDPEGEVRALCKFLDAAYEPGMLDFYSDVPARLAQIPHHRKLTSPIDAASVGRYRELSSPEIATIESICAEGMEAFGYGRITAATSPARRRSGRPLVRQIRQRLLFYGLSRRRWQRGMFRWKIIVKAWFRHAFRTNRSA